MYRTSTGFHRYKWVKKKVFTCIYKNQYGGKPTLNPHELSTTARRLITIFGRLACIDK
jgi:hypothetical protein